MSSKAKRVFESRPLSVDQLKKIAVIKEYAEYLYDAIDVMPSTPSVDYASLVGRAKHDLESCVMLAVKAVSRES